MEKLTWKNGEKCRYGNTTVVIGKNFDLELDYYYPRTHKAIYRDGRPIRVIIDHDATYIGDTVVRSVPRGWTVGDRTFAS